MPSDDEKDEKFGENPFSRLDSSVFPSCRKNVPGRPRTSLSPAQEENELFIRAMANFAAPAPRHGGFLLSDHCQLPVLSKKMKTPSVPSLPPEPQKKPEEPGLDEFLLAMRNATPLAGKGRKIAQVPARKEILAAAESSLEDFMAGKLEFALLYTDEYLEGHVVGLDELVMGRLRAGQLSPEAHLDLHGLNAIQAFESLRVFMREAWFKGLRVVLIIPGRGRNSPEGMGILRQKLQAWLTQEPFKRIVLGFCTAQPHDGGPGSVYVLLRKYRKKGRIYWDRWPSDSDLY